MNKLFARDVVPYYTLTACEKLGLRKIWIVVIDNIALIVAGTEHVTFTCKLYEIINSQFIHKFNKFT